MTVVEIDGKSRDIVAPAVFAIPESNPGLSCDPESPMPRPIALLILLLLATSGLAQQNLRVLFIGNSYTFYNDLPRIVQDLADSGGHFVLYGQSTPGGFSFGQHLNHGATRTALADTSGWDFVVLQEQSQMPVIPFYRDTSTRPSARGLDSLATLAGAQSLFYMTWGRRLGGQQCINGHCSAPFADYDEMQDSLTAAYLALGAELDAPVAPAGLAWQLVRSERPWVDLWDPDNSHPNATGSYLSACVITAMLLDEPVADWPFTNGLDEELAAFLRSKADEAVALLHGTDVARCPETFQPVEVAPNPFNPQTRIRWAQPRDGFTNLTLYDLLGRQVAVLADGWLALGEHERVWNGTGADGQPLASGVYFYRLVTPNATDTGRLTLLH